MLDPPGGTLGDVGAELYVGATEPDHGARSAQGAQPHVQRERRDREPHDGPGETEGKVRQKMRSDNKQKTEGVRENRSPCFRPK